MAIPGEVMAIKVIESQPALITWSTMAIDIQEVVVNN